MERALSVCGPILEVFQKITKEMTPENRVDLLTDGLLNYGREVKENLGKKVSLQFTHTHIYIYNIFKLCPDEFKMGKIVCKYR